MRDPKIMWNFFALKYFFHISSEDDDLGLKYLWVISSETPIVRWPYLEYFNFCSKQIHFKDSIEFPVNSKIEFEIFGDKIFPPIPKYGYQVDNLPIPPISTTPLPLGEVIIVLSASCIGNLGPIKMT